jgi:hypothetical protein
MAGSLSPACVHDKLQALPVVVHVPDISTSSMKAKKIGMVLYGIWIEIVSRRHLGPFHHGYEPILGVVIDAIAVWRVYSNRAAQPV